MTSRSKSVNKELKDPWDFNFEEPTHEKKNKLKSEPTVSKPTDAWYSSNIDVPRVTWASVVADVCAARDCEDPDREAVKYLRERTSPIVLTDSPTSKWEANTLWKNKTYFDSRVKNGLGSDLFRVKEQAASKPVFCYSNRRRALGQLMEDTFEDPEVSEQAVQM